MATNTRAEVTPVFDCTIGQGDRGLDEFEPEAQRGGLWLRVPSPTPEDVHRWEPYVAPPRRRSWPLLVPVVIAAAAAGAALSWVAMRASEPETAQPRAVSRPAAAALPAPPSAVPAPAAAAETPSHPAALAPEAPLDAVTLSPAAVSGDPALERMLAAVSDAYRTLDPAAVTAIWPGADTSALATSFAALKYQSLSFERCELRRTGDAGAIASCQVSIAAAPKSGDPALLQRREAWTLAIDRSSDRWTIAGVSVR